MRGWAHQKYCVHDGGHTCVGTRTCNRSGACLGLGIYEKLTACLQPVSVRGWVHGGGGEVGTVKGYGECTSTRRGLGMDIDCLHLRGRRHRS